MIEISAFFNFIQLNHPDKTPNNAQLLNTINEKIRKSELVESRKSIGLSTSTTIKSAARFGTASAASIMSPANRILVDLKNTSASSFSIQSSLSRISLLNTSRTANTSRLTSASTIKGGSTLSSIRALQLLENSVDVMVSKAEELFYNCEYKRCIKVIEKLVLRNLYDNFFLLNYCRFQYSRTRPVSQENSVCANWMLDGASRHEWPLLHGA